MTDEGQLEFGGLLGDESEPKKPARKRRPAQTAVPKPGKSPASESALKPGSAREDGPPVEAPADQEPAVETVEEPGPAAETAAVTEDPVLRRTGPELAAPAEAVTEPTSEVTFAAAPVAEIAPTEPTPPRLFFLTNRMNLNGVLSSRVLAPRESFHKYYADLLDLAPGWIPVLTGPPPAALIKRVVSERGAGAPVLIELSETVLDEPPHGQPGRLPPRRSGVRHQGDPLP